MKKLMKRIGAVLMAVAMMAALGVTGAFAADTYKVSYNNIAETDTHEYKVYQIFTGDLSTDGKTLSNVKYGNSGYGTAGDPVPSNILDGITNADTFARSIADDLTTEVGTITATNKEITGLAPGYYMIVDDTSKELTEGDAYSAYIVQLVNDLAIDPKKSTTSVDKTIKSDTLGKDDTITEVNGKVDNVSIGDTVNFEITGTVPSHATDYDYFFYILGDTLTDGLTFDANSVEVSASTDGALKVNKDYALYTGDDADGKTFQIALIDAKALAGQTITVTYSATLNENANIGETSNDNKVVIEYSNNPNHNYDGDKKDTTPGKPDSEKNSPLGVTPETKTTTYTTGIQIQKVDENGKPLTGAEFTITGDNEEIVLVSTETFTAANDGTYYQLKNNTYTTEIPVEADYMKPASEDATAGYVEDSTYDEDDKVVIGSKTYRPYNKDEDNGMDVYILVKANASEYKSTTQKYKKTVTYTQKDTNSSGITATAEVGEDGVVTFNGLGAGSYTITESKTPNGYNTIADITFTIDFTAEPTGSNPHWSTTSNDATYNAATGEFELTIENQKGATLPSTGGIGTYVFTVAGVAIMAIAAGLLIVRHKKKAE